jgi:hypothetical protein
VLRSVDLMLIPFLAVSNWRRPFIGTKQTIAVARAKFENDLELMKLESCGPSPIKGNGRMFV